MIFPNSRDHQRVIGCGPSPGTTIPSPLSFCLRVSGASLSLRVVMVPCSFGARFNGSLQSIVQ